MGKALVFDFNSKWSGKFYKQKRIEAFYLIEENNIITVTVYVFYGKWEDKQ
ncbi:MAG: hypothetical protein ABII90_04245 [Bacteroidota bacterium]